MPGPAPCVLVVEDNPADARLAQWTLAHEPDGPYMTLVTDRVALAVARLQSGGVDAVLLDRGLPDSQDLDGIRTLRSRAPKVAVILLSGAEDTDLTPRSLAAGAQDHLVKGLFAPGKLGGAVRRAIGRQQVESQVIASGLPNPDPWDHLSTWGIGGAVVHQGQIVRSNERFTSLTGSAAGPDPVVPATIASIVERVPVNARDGTGYAERVSVGPEGSHLVLSVVRLLHTPDGPRHLVWIWEPGTERAPETPPPWAAPILDAPTWVQLREMARSDPEFLPALVAAFHAEAGRLVRQVEAADARGDPTSLARAAHQLKSTCAQLGVQDMARRCAELEAGISDRAVRAAAVQQVLRDFEAAERAVDAEISAG